MDKKELDFSQHPIDEGWSFAEFRPGERAKFTHGYHRYPAKYIPQLAEKLIAEYIKDDNALVNDPFMGSGTTIVSALSSGHRACGTDINKIAFLMTKAKSYPLEPKLLEKKIEEFLALAKNLDGIEAVIPPHHEERIDYWFEEENKLKLGKLLAIILKEEDTHIKDFFLVCFSHILKNCSVWMQGSTKPTRDMKKKPSEPLDTMKRHLNKMKKGNLEYFNALKSEIKENPERYIAIKNQDASHQPTDDNSVDLIVTSSPYVTSYEYADLHQLSTIWLDFSECLKEYKKNFIGSSTKESKNEKLQSAIAVETINKMKDVHAKTASEIETFFIDMQRVIKESFRILKPGARACYVIGNTSLKKIPILNAEIFAELMISAGFKIDRVIKREIPSKLLPSTRDENTGRFAKSADASAHAYPTELIVVAKKP